MLDARNQNCPILIKSIRSAIPIRERGGYLCSEVLQCSTSCCKAYYAKGGKILKIMLGSGLQEVKLNLDALLLYHETPSSIDFEV